MSDDGQRNLFQSLSEEDWRVLVDEYEINEPTICYPDPVRRGCVVGPLVTVHVGATVDDDCGDEALDLSGADGRNLAAVMCLPQFAQLFKWIREEQKSLELPHPDPVARISRFYRELINRVDWIESCIDDRDEVMSTGMHGMARYERLET